MGGQLDIQLRDVQDADLDIFFLHQSDPEANHMAAFTRANPSDRSGFDVHMERILLDIHTVVRTIVVGDDVLGSILKYVEGGQSEVSYWIGKEHWGQGIATTALAKFLCVVTQRPIRARVAFDNHGSMRVLEKNGFSVIERTQFFANARGKEIEELVLELT